MFWCPAEGTLSFDADDVGSPDPVPNLYDPQNHGAFGPRPAMHQIAWVRWMDSISACWICSCKETMEHGVIRCRTSSYFDGPTSKKRVLGTRLPRKWLLWGKSKTIQTLVPWNYKSLPKNDGLVQKTFFLMILGPPGDIHRLPNCQAPSCAKCSSKSPSGLCNTKTSTPEPRSISALE